MFNSRDIWIQQERQQDFLRAAEQDRLARLALTGRRARPWLYSRFLAWFGGRLVALGAWLKERNGEPVMLTSGAGLKGG